MKCPPCNHNCNQGRDCPARGEFSEYSRGRLTREGASVLYGLLGAVLWGVILWAVL